MDHLTQIWQSIQDVLNIMGSQAISTEKPYGLRCYPHLHKESFPGLMRVHAWEERLSDGLARGLRDRGLGVLTEKFYPNSRERCDLVIPIEPTGKLWIEFKTAYREDLGGVLEGTKPVEQYGKRSWIAGVSDIAAKDIVKLNRLKRPDAAHAGILLLGFDRIDRPLADDELY